MQVYAILLLFNQVVASIGPWPSDLAGCQKNMPESDRNIDKAFNDPKTVAKLREKWPNLQRKDVEWKCIESDTKPYIKDPVYLND